LYCDATKCEALGIGVGHKKAEGMAFI